MGELEGVVQTRNHNLWNTAKVKLRRRGTVLKKIQERMQIDEESFQGNESEKEQENEPQKAEVMKFKIKVKITEAGIPPLAMS